MATFYDANISISGETEHEAFTDIKGIILDTLDTLEREPESKLGPWPVQQLAILRDFIGRPDATQPR